MDELLKATLEYERASSALKLIVIRHATLTRPLGSTEAEEFSKAYEEEKAASQRFVELYRQRQNSTD